MEQRSDSSRLSPVAGSVMSCRRSSPSAAVRGLAACRRRRARRAASRQNSSRAAARYACAAWSRTGASRARPRSGGQAVPVAVVPPVQAGHLEQAGDLRVAAGAAQQGPVER
ncbi:MAG TPA: hypothetical protein VH480_19850 [Streptosporangiaceae bacterium]